MNNEYNSAPAATELATTEYYVHSIEYLLKVVQELCSVHTLEEITKIVLIAVRKLTGSDGATFVLSDNGFSYYVDEDAISPMWKGQRFPMDTTISGWVMRNCQLGIIEDVSVDHRSSHYFYENTFIKSMAMVAICPKGGIDAVGAIGTYWGQHYQPTHEEVKLLQLLADSTAIAMDNVAMYVELQKKLSDRTTALEIAQITLLQETQERKAIEAEIRRISHTDELTGLHNRRGFYLMAEQHLRLAKRSQMYTSIMFIELSTLTYIHETFGHEFAEDAIVLTANLLKQSLRNSDTLGRIEEDQFVVLVQGYQLVCEVIEQRMEANIHQFNQTQQLPFPLSITIGVYPYDSSQTISLDDLIALAHLNIHQTKLAQSENPQYINDNCSDTAK
ncbi:diguanylate cyclase [Anabaena cylindrica FACHB-243]|uniref:Diguanylate cyclase with GAF sensor n=1 Tax=Anabaena cylindrica (strain ATCC 27899 / PCC 7122) TaxID=272123 RepID=K9ZB45_ANACC|nr:MULTISPECIES: diguanylate cyclase [Anabaena]AFZ56423.1 diguanylate cyclase with GAF sensor [Anabaena cylindrica PCC 7122]MBD2418126.1 diguanylate cyclase [Anabaena cylindrica FACHB-243]MBY5281972.1 diguanylate cyclase [Anabaena sp. CCAP 1446/1C]MBY5311373.1 diguanylate cyclase [Anabaena sp. CCAP 1446/1C]MCM2407404.1 diguanylate cyclase [Anabaena sp. CCAP 1446/1C]